MRVTSDSSHGARIDSPGYNPRAVVAPPAVWISLLVLSFPCAVVWAAEPPKPGVALTTDTQGRRVFELRGVDADELESIGDRFAAYAVFDGQIPDPPPLAGDYSVVDGAIRFT